MLAPSHFLPRVLSPLARPLARPFARPLAAWRAARRQRAVQRAQRAYRRALTERPGEAHEPRAFHGLHTLEIELLTSGAR